MKSLKNMVQHILKSMKLMSLIVEYTHVQPKTVLDLFLQTALLQFKVLQGTIQASKCTHNVVLVRIILCNFACTVVL